MEGKCEIETNAAGTSSREGFATGKPVNGLITSITGVGSLTGSVGMVCATVADGVVESDGFAGEVVPTGRLGLQLLSARLIKMIERRGKRLLERCMADKDDSHFQSDCHLIT